MIVVNKCIFFLINTKPDGKICDARHHFFTEARVYKVYTNESACIIIPSKKEYNQLA